MTAFANLIEQETASTINGLIGREPEVVRIDEGEASEISLPNIFSII